MLWLEGVGKQFAHQELFCEASLAIHGHERLGVIGANGAGKTTLFRMIMGLESYDSGEIRFSGGVRVGLLSQELAASERSVLVETMAGDNRLEPLQQERQMLLDQVARSDIEEIKRTQYVERLGEVEHALEDIGVYEAEARAGEILSGLGFSVVEQAKPLSSFSGGWRMRVALAQLLFSQPDIMLLDEPTNHLDVESVTWLERYLCGLPRTLLIISHDRGFLNRVVQGIIDVDGGKLNRYRGDFDHYLAQKAEKMATLEKMAAKQAKQVEMLNCFIRRFRAKASKARQVQSRVKMLEKMAPVEQLPQSQQQLSFRLPEPTPSARDVFILRHLDKKFSDKVVFKGAKGHLIRGEKIALLGPNGAGKSTLLKILAGVLEVDQGKVIRGDRVKPAYFAQHAVDALPLDKTVLEAAMSGEHRLTEERVRTLLGGFLFSGKRVLKQVSVLSGGEKARLALARMFLSGANVLLLDEPTNHLDMTARAALEEALASYAGTLVLISHDQDLLEAVCDRYWIVKEGKLQPWEDDLTVYLEKVIESRRRVRQQRVGVSKKQSQKAVKQQVAQLRQQLSRQLKPWRKEAERLETQIEQWEEKRAILEQEIADPELYNEENRARLKACSRESMELESALEKAMTKWETLSLQIEEATDQTDQAIQQLQSSLVV
ncbi:ABC-F family ATP-binding cassette domain-containing protein [Magnetococcales bacterium HHB-1]